MFISYNYYRQHNNDQAIDDHKEFYKKFSNEREFGGNNFHHLDHLIKNRFMDIGGFMSNIVLRKLPSKILDIGCGAGINLPLSKTFDSVQYYGIDYAETTLEHSRKMYPNVEFAVMDAFNLTFEDKTFDMTIISSVLILYEKGEDRQTLLANAYRVLKDDGILVAILWNNATLLRWSIQFSRLIAKIKGIPLPEDFMALHFNEKEANAMFKKANFSIQQIIHTSSLYGALESTRYLNMSKYKRDFGKGEQEQGSEKEQSILKDLQKSSNSESSMRFFYFISKFFPSLLAMFSIYVLKKK